MNPWDEEWCAEEHADLEEWWGVGVGIRQDYGLTIVGGSSQDTEEGRARMVACAKLAAAAPEMARLLMRIEEYFAAQDGRPVPLRDDIEVVLRKAGVIS